MHPYITNGLVSYIPISLLGHLEGMSHLQKGKDKECQNLLKVLGLLLKGLSNREIIFIRYFICDKIIAFNSPQLCPLLIIIVAIYLLVFIKRYIFGLINIHVRLLFFA